MDVDDKAPSTAMVNGHPGDGEYTAEDLFSGPAVESPEPTNEPTPPFTERPEGTLLPAPPSMVSGVEQAPDVLATSSRPKTHTPPSLQPPPLSTNTDIEMTGAAPSKAQSKPFHDHPTSGEPPAKRFKTDPSPTYDTSKKIPANQQKFLSALLRQVKKPKDALPFLQPVDPVKLNIPRYFDIITRPMDISTIEKKLNSGQYPVAQALVDDFNLMVNNCVTFNGPDNPITKMGRNIQAIFEKGMKTLPPETVFGIL
jgi:bromodomain-containing factor 1